ncbi:MAG: hypothetical protein FJY73_02065 [Candidatus Eisenbacteria bacterium]|nr:hypothetical protein [Candidatus Eisenbacteria bacterium]
MPPRRDRFDRKRIRSVPVAGIGHKVRIEQFASPIEKDAAVGDLLRSLPDLLAARDLNRVIDRIVSAARAKDPVLFLFGAHVVKCGLAPVLIPLIREGIVTALATNGAAAIHDYEIARFGSTSENVPENLPKGIFGMARETAEGMNRAAREGAKEGIGLGEAVGRALVREKAPHRERSIFAAAYEACVPISVHVAVGTDIVHMHESADGAAIGEATMLDFLAFVASVETLTDRSVVLHAGSAVILPEVFLKAVAMVQSAGKPPAKFLAVDLDMNRAYRPTENVLRRPSGEGIHLTGHHEILIPLLAAGIRGRLGR